MYVGKRKKKIFFGGVDKKPIFVVWGGGSERYGHVRSLYFLTPSLTKPCRTVKQNDKFAKKYFVENLKSIMFFKGGRWVTRESCIHHSWDFKTGAWVGMGYAIAGLSCGEGGREGEGLRIFSNDDHNLKRLLEYLYLLYNFEFIAHGYLINERRCF